MNYRYRLYGLGLVAQEELAGLQEGSSCRRDEEVCLELNGEPAWVGQARLLPSRQLHQLESEPATEGPAFMVISYGAGRFFGLSYSDGTEFMVDGLGRRVWGTWQAPWTKEDFATYLLGPLMGFLLRQRGVTPLHASAVCLAGRAFLFCGDAQTGKSTTAAALALRGAPVLCEDIAALRPAKEGHWVEPGYRRICLWPDSVRSLLGREDGLPRLTPNWEKRYLPLDGVLASFQGEASPIGAIYLLAPRSAEEGAPRIEPLAPKQALLDLVQNSYMNWLHDRQQRATEFNELARIALKIPIRRIVPHRDPDRIDALCRAIQADADALLQGN